MILVPVGTRAELIKVSSLLLELEERGEEYRFINLNQHPLEDTIGALSLPDPDRVLGDNLREEWRESGLRGLWTWYREGMGLLREVWEEENGPKAIVGHGNTLGMYMAMKTGDKYGSERDLSVHLEAGVRSFFPRRPDFNNWRRARFADFMYGRGDGRADLNVAVMESSAVNLDGYGGETLSTGDPVAEIVDHALGREPEEEMPEGDYIAANATRSIDSKRKAEEIIRAAEEIDREIVYVVNPKIEEGLRKHGLWERFSEEASLRRPMDYVSFVHLMANSDGVITDSNSTQEECAVLGKPCIVTNDFAQFPELVYGGAVRVAGCDSSAIREAVSDADDFGEVSIADGKATSRLLDRIEEEIG